MRIERSRSKFRGNEKEDAGRTSVRVPSNIPADQVDYGFKLSLREGLTEAICESIRQEAVGRTSCSNCAQEVWAREEESP